jgi:hypothetical protein
MWRRIATHEVEEISQKKKINRLYLFTIELNDRRHSMKISLRENSQGELLFNPPPISRMLKVIIN